MKLQLHTLMCLRKLTYFFITGMLGLCVSSAPTVAQWVAPNPPDTYILGGRVGIGTSLPQDLLHIHGSGPTHTILRLSYGDEVCDLAGRLMIHPGPGQGSYPQGILGDVMLWSDGVTGGSCGRNLVLGATHADNTQPNFGQIHFITGDGVTGFFGATEKARLLAVDVGMNQHTLFDVKNGSFNGGNSALRLYASDGAGVPLSITDAWTIGIDEADQHKLKFASDTDPAFGDAQITIAPWGNIGIGNAKQQPTARIDMDAPAGTSWMNFSTRPVTPGQSISYVFWNNAAQDHFEIAVFDEQTAAWQWDVFTITPAGDIGIGTEQPAEELHVIGDAEISDAVWIGPQRYDGTGLNETLRLSVDGAIAAREIMVQVNNWADFVFDDDYELMPLDQLEMRINTDKSLPGIPSEAQIRSQGGVSLDKMQVQLLQKVEELTLYMIEQHKRIGRQEQLVEELQKRNDELAAKLMLKQR